MLKGLNKKTRTESIVNALQKGIAVEGHDGGLTRSLAKMRLNQRLTGNDYARLTLAVTYMLLKIDEATDEIDELEAEQAAEAPEEEPSDFVKGLFLGQVEKPSDHDDPEK